MLNYHGIYNKALIRNLLANKFLILAFLSGVCGIAYEITYSRLLSIYLGDMFYVQAAILISFILSIGLGSLVAHKLIKYFWFVELSIGLIAVAIAYSTYYPGLLLEYLTPYSSSPALTLFITFLITIIPASFIGVSVPLFSIVLQNDKSHKQLSSAFTDVYLYYNLGAALCVLLIEFVIFRYIGIRESLYFLSFINFYISICLYRANNLTSGILNSEKESGVKEISNGYANFYRYFIIIFLVSCASGIYQLFALRLLQKILGPFHDNFALLIISSLFGIAIGAEISKKWSKRISEFYSKGIILVLAIYSLLILWIILWGAGNFTLQNIKLNYIFMLVWALSLNIIPMILFGAIIPLTISNLQCKLNTPGRALAVACFANITGYLFTLLVLFTYCSDEFIISLVCIFLVMASILVKRKENHYQLKYLLTIVVLFVVNLIMWPRTIISFGFMAIESPGSIQKLYKDIEAVESYTRNNSYVGLLKTRDNEHLLNINGYISLKIPNHHKLIREVLFGIIPYSYTKNTGEKTQALVLGLGTGASTFGAASFYDNVDVVEINQLMVDLQDKFRDVNYEVTSWPNVKVHQTDGITYTATTNKKYDAILNTVTSPRFFSSSKLYSADFFQLAKTKLKKNGVYALWFDFRVTHKGQLVLQETLKNNFNFCHFTLLNFSYLQAICSDSELKPNFALLDNIKKQQLAQYLSLQFNTVFKLSDIAKYLVFPGHDLYFKQWYGYQNTFNFPILEYIMLNRTASNKMEDIFDLLNVKMQSFADGINKSTYDKEILERTFILQVIAGDHHANKLLGMFYGSDLPGEYINIVSRNIKTLYMPPSVIKKYIRRLYLEQRWVDLYTLTNAVITRPKKEYFNYLTELYLSNAIAEYHVKGDVGESAIQRLASYAPLETETRTLLLELAKKKSSDNFVQYHKQYLQGVL